MDRTALEAVISAALNGTDDEYVARLCQLHGVVFDPKKNWDLARSAWSDADLFRLIVEISLSGDFTADNIRRKEPAETLPAAAKRYKVDAVKIRFQAEEQLKEAEGGARREVKKPAAKKPAVAKKKASPPKKPSATKKPKSAVAKKKK